MKKRILFGIIILILMIVTIASLLTTSQGNTEKLNGHWWTYDVVDGEAVNARIYTNYQYSLTEFAIPSYLGGYPVTSICGKPGFPNPVNVMGLGYWYWGQNPYGETGLVVSNISKLHLPNSLKEIGDYSFHDMRYLTTINIPESLERIGHLAFYNTKIKKINLDGLTYIASSAFSDSGIEEVTITNMDILTGFGNSNSLKTVYVGEGVNEIRLFGYCPNATVYISSDVKKINRYAFRGMTDIYVDNYEEDVEIYDQYGSENMTGLPYIHFKQQEKVSKDLPEGVKLIDANTNEEIVETKYPTGSDVTLKLVQEEGYNYTDYVVYMETDGQKNTSKEKIARKIDLSFDKEYTIHDLQRNTKIYFHTRKDGLDLNLRQYLDSVNGEKLVSKREPVVETTFGVAKYLHTKDIIYPQNADKLTYGIRVYNEGTIPGTAREVKFYIPEGLNFNDSSEINSNYLWQISDDGRVATTGYLRDKIINEYTIYDVSYEQLYIDLIVDTEQSETVKRLVTMATITDATGEDVDSTFGEIENPNDSTYKQEESESSNENSYIAGDDDDTDFENVYIANRSAIPYSLIIKKIDGIDSELLDGATFDLLDENQKPIKTGVTAQGGELNFGTIYTFGLTKNTYYVRETYTPEGYRNVYKYLIQVDLVNEYTLTSGLQTKLELNVLDIDIDTSRYEEIEISTKEELKNIQSNSDKKYVLTDNIDLSGENWTPLNVENVVLDGQNHKITGLTINSDAETTNKFGLFETYSGIIENLTLEDVDINVTKNIPEEEEGEEAEEEEEEPKLETEADIDAVGAFVGYSKQVVLKNCNVTGNIETNVRNVGGFVGHTKADTMIVTRECTNETTITATSHNVGGIVGCALGPVKMYDTVNKAAITAKSYNAGGLVGYVSPSGYEFTQIVPDFNTSNQLITLAIKNDSIKNKYQFKIEKVDSEGNLLNGAKFKVLDNNKEVIDGYEEVQVQDGIIEFETTTVENIGTDVYYLKEVQAPEGYEILANHYIKVAIEKKWNREKAAYYMEVETKELTEEQFEEDGISSRNTSKVKTGLTYSGTTNNIVLNVAELEIRNSSNEGIITNDFEYTVTGGLVGSSKGRTEIYNSSNKAQVSAIGGNAKTAGIIAEIIEREDVNTRNIAIVNNCSNEGEINGEGAYENQEGTTAGILAFARIQQLSMEGNDNAGTVYGKYTSTSGVLGNALGTITIQKCTNTGSVTSEIDNEMVWTWQNVYKESFESAGIFAKNIYIKKDEVDVVSQGPLTIVECTNEGDISGYIHVAGILAVSDVDSITVDGCYTKNCDLILNEIETSSVSTNSKCSVSGIVGYAVNPSITIVNSNVEKVNINNLKPNIYATEYTKTAGILAEVATYFGEARSLYNENNPQTYTIYNCNVKESYLTSNTGDTAGIVAFGGWGNTYGYDITANISKCNVTDSHITNEEGGRNSSVSGIYGQGYSVATLNINECNVTDSEIKATGTYNKVGGVYGFGYNWNTGYVNINNTNVSGCTIYNPNGDNTSGIMAGVYMPSNTDNTANKRQVAISKCKVYDSEITGGVNTAGIFNVTSGGGGNSTPNGAKATATECTVEKTTINADGVCAGGIVGQSNIYCYITTCNVIDSDIMNTGTNTGNYGGPNTGGIAGNVFNGAEIYSCNVTDTDIISTSERTTGQTGGLAGLITSEPKIAGCTVGGTSEKMKIEGHGSQVGGITCWYFRNGGEMITSCTVDNVKIVHNTSNSTNSTTGGIIAMDFGSDSGIQLTGLTFKNSTIESNAQNVGGLMGVKYGSKENIQSCTIENVDITSKDIYYAASAYSIGAMGGVIGQAQEMYSGYYGITVRNVNLESTAHHVGGVLGSTWSTTSEFYNLTIDGLNIEHTNTEGKGTKGVGGVVGLVGYNDRTVSVYGLVLKNVDIDVASGNSSVHAGGIMGQANIGDIYENEPFNEIHVKNLSSGTTGGLIGHIYGSSSNDITASGWQLTNSTVEGNNAGGMIGLVTITNNITMNGPTLNNVEVKGTGGILGMSNADKSFTINGLTIDTLKVENTGYNNTGGVIGFAHNPNINGGTIKDLEVSATSSASAGGLVGLIPGLMQDSSSKAIFKGITFTSSEGKRNTITITNSSNVGILLGFGRVETESINISNVDVNASNAYNIGVIGITDEGSNIQSITLSDSTITSDKGNVGGIVGLLKGDISDCTLDGTTITVSNNTASNRSRRNSRTTTFDIFCNISNYKL